MKRPSLPVLALLAPWQAGALLLGRQGRSEARAAEMAECLEVAGKFIQRPRTVEETWGPIHPGGVRPRLGLVRWQMPRSAAAPLSFTRSGTTAHELLRQLAHSVFWAVDARRHGAE